MKNSKFGEPLKHNDFTEQAKIYIQEFKNNTSKDTAVKAARGFVEAMRLWIIYYGERRVEQMLDMPFVEGEWSTWAKGKSLADIRRATTVAEYIKGLGDERCYFEVRLLRARVAYQKGYNLRCYQILHELNERWKHLPNEEQEKLTKKNLLMTRINLVAGKALNQDRDHALARVHYGMAYHNGEIGRQLKDHYSLGRTQTVFARSFLEYKIGENVKEYLKKAARSYDDYFGNISEDSRTQLFYSEVYEIEARNEIAIGRRATSDGGQNIIGNAKFAWEKAALLDLKKARRVTNGVLKLRSNHRRKAHQRHIHGRIELAAALRLLRSNGYDFDERVVRRLKKAEWAFIREFRIRHCYFGQESHPSLAKVCNFLCRTLLLRAEGMVQTASNKHGETDPAEYNGLRKRAIQYLQKAEQARRLGSRFNRRSETVEPHPEYLFSDLSEVSEKLRHVINDFQAFRNEGRKLECQYFRYRFAELTGDGKQKVFSKMMATYARCEELLVENIKWFAYSESQEELNKKFQRIQQIVLSACDQHLTLFPEKKAYVHRFVYRVFLHDSASFDSTEVEKELLPKLRESCLKNGTPGIKGMMNAIQTANYYRLLEKATTQKAPPDNLFKRFETYAKAIIDHHRDRLIAIHQFNKAFKVKRGRSVNPSKDRRLNRRYRAYRRSRWYKKGVRDQALEEAWQDYQSNGGRGKYEQRRREAKAHKLEGPGDMMKLFDKGTSRGLVAFFLHGNELYAFGMFSDEAGNRTAKFICLARRSSRLVEQLKRDIEGLGNYSKRITKMVEMPLNKADASNNNKLLLMQRDFSFVSADAVDLEEALNDTFPQRLTRRIADKINSRFVSITSDIYSKLFPEGFVPKGIEALYYIPNSRMLSLLPVGLLPTKDIRELGDGLYAYKDLGYLGALMQIAYMPSLYHLYKLGDLTGRVDELRRKRQPTRDEIYKKLVWLRRKIILGISPTSSVTNDEAASLGKENMREINRVLYGCFSQNTAEGKVFFYNGKGLPPGQKRKAAILEESLRALIVYFFGHVKKVGRENGPHKMMIHNSKDDFKPIDPARPWYEAMEISAFSIYNEEIGDADYGENFLFFLNGCEAAFGEERSGLLPFSLVAACLEAGAQAVIGTNLLVDAQAASTFSAHFFNVWFDDTNESVTSIGETIQKAIRMMLNGPAEANDDTDEVRVGAKSHPLNWGGYLLMGNLNLRFSDMLKEVFYSKH